MKIIYALDGSIDSQIFLSRFLPNVNNHQIKIYCHGLSNLFNVDINLNYFRPFKPFKTKYYFDINSKSLEELANLIKNYKPDLIISDNELYTAFVANELNINFINCSMNYIYFLIKGTGSYNDEIYYSTMTNLVKKNLLINNKTYVPSFICDLDYEIKSVKKNDMEFIRPYFKLSKSNKSKDTHVSLVDKKLYAGEYFTINNCNSKEYFDSIKESKYCLTECFNTFICDNFYHNKKSILFKPKQDDQYQLLNFLVKNNFAEIYKNNNNTDIEEISCLEFSNSKYLHEIIEEI